MLSLDVWTAIHVHVFISDGLGEWLHGDRDDVRSGGGWTETERKILA